MEIFLIYKIVLIALLIGVAVAGVWVMKRWDEMVGNILLAVLVGVAVGVAVVMMGVWVML